jgi:pimeloyl-ACP methyl ester carboxylesterase
MGHSFGELCAQQYALMYPHKIKGLILIDSTSYNFQKLYDFTNPVMISLISIDEMINNNLNTSKKSKEELQLKFKLEIDEYEKILPTDEARRYKELVTNPVFFITVAKEFEHWGDSSKNLQAMKGFPLIPLVVIARDQEVSVKSFSDHDIPVDETVLYEAVWRELQTELSQLSSNGELVIAVGSDHEVHIDRPDIIIQCLKRFI